MTKKWIAISVLLFVVAGLLGWRLYASITRYNAQNDPGKIQPVPDIKEKLVQEKPMAKLPPAVKYLPEEFAVIPEQNLFSESRSKEEETEVESPSKTPPLTQKPILVGVSISDSQVKAIIIDPTSSSNDRNRRTQVIRIGDVYRGYKITHIESDRIILESGEQKEIIPLHEGAKQPRGGKTPILSTRVVNFGSGSKSGGVQIIGPSGTATATTNVARKTTPAAPAPKQRTTVRPTGAQTPPQVSSEATSTNAPTPAPKTQRITPRTNSQGQRVIRTPFGDIVRPDID